MSLQGEMVYHLPEESYWETYPSPQFSLMTNPSSLWALVGMEQLPTSYPPPSDATESSTTEMEDNPGSLEAEQDVTWELLDQSFTHFECSPFKHHTKKEWNHSHYVGEN